MSKITFRKGNSANLSSVEKIDGQLLFTTDTEQVEAYLDYSDGSTVQRKKFKVGAGGDITVDQAYDSTSTNPQSGTAVSSAVAGKADKVSGATDGNLAGLDSNGNLTDSGKKAADFLNEIRGVASGIDGAVVYQQTKDGTNWDNKIAYVKGWSDKADKVSGATNGNFASLDSNGNLTDSGKKPSNFLTQHQDISDRYSTGDTAETALADADYVPFYDTSASAKRKTLWSNIKAKLKAYFDGYYRGAGDYDSWSTVTNKPFEAVTDGLATDSGNNLVTYLQEFERTGTASATAVSYQRIKRLNTWAEITGSKYMELTNTSATTYTFTNNAITTSSVIDVYTDTYGDNPSDVSVSSGSCTVTFAQAKTRTVRIYIK